MRHTALLLSLLIFCIISCQKEPIQPVQNENDFVTRVKSYLKNSMKPNDFQSLDFNTVIATKTDSDNILLVRVAINGKPLSQDFVLLKTDTKGNGFEGKIINISGNVSTTDKHRLFNGSITLSSLSRTSVLSSPIENGYVVAFHPNLFNSRITSPTVVLPEVIVISLVQTIPWTDFLFYLQGLMNNGNSGSNTSGNYSSGNTSGGFGGVIPDNATHIDFESFDTRSPISVPDYVKCFTQMSDVGATCSIEILTDIPVDNKPLQSFDWTTGSPGHTFLQIRKSNGGQIISQNIGFYPEVGWKNALTTAPQNGKFIDNAGHEFNASLKMDLTPAQFQNMLTEIQYLARFVRYDIDEYNCTDFALEVFNSVRGGNQLQIPKYDIPGGSAPGGTSTPQGLYQTLKNMKYGGGPESNNVTVPGVKGFAGASNGPCN